MKKVTVRRLALGPADNANPLRIRLVSAFALFCLLVAIGLVSSRPAHTAGGPVPVTVANAPLATRPIDIATPAQPFAHRMDILIAAGAANQSFTVPVNKRLVLTYVSSNCAVAPGAKAVFDLGTIANGQLIESHLPLVPQGVILGRDVYALSCPVTVYADSGSTVTVSVLDSDSVNSGGLVVGLFGYYVDVP
jgi:hypothetical protein